MKKIQAIIFDLEGVIIDTERLWDKETTIFLKKRGIEYKREEIKHLCTGRSVFEVANILKHTFHLEGEPEQLGNERLQTMKELIKTDLQFIQGFKEFHQQISPRFKTAIATAMDKELLEITKKAIDLTRFFPRTIFSIADVNHRSKPNPDIFLYAAKQLNTDPKDCIVIEDSPLGIQAAKRAGMRAVAITTTYDKDKLQEADLITSSFEGLYSVLTRS
jgi:HAD superfamily hydrolase (TIGR01509 family)